MSSLNEQAMQTLATARQSARRESDRPASEAPANDYLQAKIVTLDCPEDGSSITTIRITARDGVEMPDHIYNLFALYQAIANAIRVATNDRGYVVRFASQVRGQNFPFIFHATRLLTIVDPLAVLHNAIGTLVKRGSLTLQVFDSQHYHTKSTDEVRQATMVDRNGAWPRMQVPSRDMVSDNVPIRHRLMSTPTTAVNGGSDESMDVVSDEDSMVENEPQA